MYSQITFVSSAQFSPTISSNIIVSVLKFKVRGSIWLFYVRKYTVPEDGLHVCRIHIYVVIFEIAGCCLCVLTMN